jgi:hypothetical protein
MRTTGVKRAVRNALFRLGLHTTPKGVVDALAKQGIQVTEELVRQVRIALLKESDRGKIITGFSRPVRSPSVRHRPQGFPGRRGQG